MFRFLMSMNLPNKLTIIRIVMIPVFLIFAAPVNGITQGFLGGTHELWNGFISDYGLLVSGVIFVLAFATDALDGHIARSKNLVTDFGKFLDPIADKLLVTAALLALTAHGKLGVWTPVIIISREFIITGLRLLAASDGKVLAADMFGKLKTVVQTVALTFMLFENFHLDFLAMIRADVFLMYAALILTVLSGIRYIVINRELFTGME